VPAAKRFRSRPDTNEPSGRSGRRGSNRNRVVLRGNGPAGRQPEFRSRGIRDQVGVGGAALYGPATEVQVAVAEVRRDILLQTGRIRSEGCPQEAFQIALRDSGERQERLARRSTLRGRGGRGMCPLLLTGPQRAGAPISFQQAGGPQLGCACSRLPASIIDPD
jgi:hypothetical protein